MIDIHPSIHVDICRYISLSCFLFSYHVATDFLIRPTCIITGTAATALLAAPNTAPAVYPISKHIHASPLPTPTTWPTPL